MLVDAMLKYAREHFALDSYADTADDPDRLAPNPAKARAQRRVTDARTDLSTAHAELSEAIEAAAARARRPAVAGRRPSTRP